MEQGANVLNSLKNVYLAFEALTEHQFEYQCWLWGRYPQIVTYDACMKLSTNFVTKNQLNASRSELNIDVDLMTVLLQLSILSPVFFGGVRVQLVVGAGETVGTSPAWIGPGNRMSETFHESQRGSLRSASNEVQMEDGNGTALLEALGVKGKGIGDIGGLNLGELKEIFRKCFTSGISTFNNKEALVDLFERLHGFSNPQQVSYDNLFVGRGSHASAGVMTGFVPTGVMVMHKVLLTAESPQDVADAVLACKVPPDLVVYDTPCQLCPHIERQQPGLLENKGILPRLSLSASEVPSRRTRQTPTLQALLPAATWQCSRLDECVFPSLPISGVTT